MGWHAVVSSHRLDRGLILAPERYDPRRQALAELSTSVGDVADVIGTVVTSQSADVGSEYVVFNTGDAQEGILMSRPPVVDSAGIGSAKKSILPGDVIISRLRPYLRQVAMVDPGLTEFIYPGASLLCSTEFFVLRSRNAESIAFLVPFLLSPAVQEILGAAQEGGHHPRFTQLTLENLGMQEAVLASRAETSQQVEAAVGDVRNADRILRSLIMAIPAANAR